MRSRSVRAPVGRTAARSSAPAASKAGVEAGNERIDSLRRAALEAEFDPGTRQVKVAEGAPALRAQPDLDASRFELDRYAVDVDGVISGFQQWLHAAEEVRMRNSHVLDDQAGAVARFSANAFSHLPPGARWQARRRP